MRLNRNKSAATFVALAVSIGALSACSSSSSSSASATPSAQPSFLNANNVALDGVWKSSDRRFLTIAGVRGEGSETITISDLKDSLFRVSRDLEVPQAAAGNLGTGGVTTHVVLKGVGAVNPDGSVTILKEGDQGRITAWLVDQNTMEAVYSEGGAIPAQPNEPVVARYRLIRQTSSASPS